MTVLSRYLGREFLRIAAACVGVALALFLIIDFVETADKFLRHNATSAEVLQYYVYKLPGIFVVTSPVAVLLAVLITVSLRARAGELTAMFSGGIGLRRIYIPLLAGCAAVSLLSLGVSEAVAPAANKRTREIERQRVRPKAVAAQFSLNRYWVRDGNGILSAQVVDPEKHALLGFQYLEIDRDFRLVRRLDAREAVRRGDAWELRDGRERSPGDSLRAVPFARKTFDVPGSIEAFREGETPPSEMTYRRLSSYVGEARALGYDVRRHEVDLHAKISYPLLNILVSFLAVPFALRSPRSGGIFRSIGLGLLIGFGCWLTLSFSLSLGRKGLFPPAVAAWAPGVLFASVGLLLLRRARL